MIYRKYSDQPALLEKLAFVNLAAIVFVAQIGKFSCEPGRIFFGARFQDGAVSSPKTIFQPEIFVLFQVFLKRQIAPFQKRGGDAENNYFLIRRDANILIHTNYTNYLLCWSSEKRPVVFIG